MGIPSAIQAKRVIIPVGDGYDSTDPDGEGVPPEALAHGALRTVTVAGSGAKTDYNASNYTFAGERHRLPRFTDFDNAASAMPASNTKAGWQAACDGIYPILTSNQFNVDSQLAAATLEMEGGPSPSGKWLRRQITEAGDIALTSNRLRNFNLWEQSGYRPKMHLSVYIYSAGDDPGIGKPIRFYWTGGDVEANPNRNMWTGRVAGKYSANAEHSGGVNGKTLYSDQNIAGTGWHRHDVFVDFENGRSRFYVNGILLTDVSNDIFGETTDWITPGGEVDYVLLGNTMDSGREGTPPDAVYTSNYVGWSQPALDWDWRRIELADNAVWEDRTNPPIRCPDVAWLDNGDGTLTIDYIVNQGSYGSLVGLHVFYVDAYDATYIGALE